MDNNNQINVQDIMKEIKKEIEVKGYTNDLNKFDKVKFNEDLYVANHEWEVNPYRPLQGNKAAVFFKKVIRKLVYFFVEPIVMAQDGFNASLVRLMNQMGCYIDEQNKEIAELKKQIEELKGGK